MSAALGREVERLRSELAAARAELAEQVEQFFALALREVTATRALPICRDALVIEESRKPMLTQAHAIARSARLAREEAAAEGGSDCGC